MTSHPNPRRTRYAVLAAALAAGTAVPLLVSANAQAAPDGLWAGAAVDCDANKLRTLLRNGSDSEQTFTVKGPDGSATYSRTVAAGKSDQLEWSRSDGSPYELVITAPGGFKKTEKGTVGCGLGSGKPQMNTTQVFSKNTKFKGLLGADGKEHTAAAKAVRIPSMAVTNDGTVLAATDARVSGSGDLPGNIQVGLRRSTDSGATWSEPEIVHHAKTTKEGVGDSSMVVDRETNRVFLFYNYGPEGTGFFTRDSDSNAADDPNSLHAQYISSDDNGKTWSKPVELNPQVKGASWKNLFLSSGHGIQMDSGRLVQPVVYREDDDKGSHTTNIVSDDHGKTWKAGAEAGAVVNESKAVQRGSGSLVQNLRHNSDKFRYYAESPDGTGAFGPIQKQSALPDPGNNGDEISYLKPGTGKPGLTKTSLLSNTASSSARDNLTVRLSEDDGKTWSKGAVLRPGDSGYSTMAVLKDGSVGNLYEVNGSEGIAFSRFTTDWLRP